MADFLNKTVETAPQSQEEIYTSYFSPVYRYIYWRIGAKEETDDLAQDVFLKFFASQYQKDPRGALPYLYTIARNKLIDHMRKKKMDLIPEDYDAPDEINESPFDRALQSEAKNSVAKVLKILSPDQYDTIQLLYMEGLSTKEAAARMDKSEDAVRQIKARAMKSMRYFTNKEWKDKTTTI